jgi:electron transport complex protein RnfE
MTDKITEPSSLARFINGILPENPVLRLVLGICPTLAVTASMEGAITMGLAATFVLFCSNFFVSLLKRFLQPHLRILVFTIIIATFVTIVDMFLKAYMYDMSRKLGPYIPLIIVNCIIIARAEACASKSRLLPSLADALGMGLGFTLALSILASVREILADGSWFGIPVMWPTFTSWTIMKLAPGAFLTFGLVVGLNNFIRRKFEERKSS